MPHRSKGQVPIETSSYHGTGGVIVEDIDALWRQAFIPKRL
jgi:hypothetical protein